MPKLKNKALRLLKLIYLKIFRIHDSPQKIAQGVALGVFTGIMPGIGPLIALFLAFVFHTNRASALLASMISNTWVSLVTFILSIKLGSVIIGLDWREAYRQGLALIRNFDFAGLWQSCAHKVILAVFIGYLIIAAGLGLTAYLLTLIITRIMYAHKNRAHLSG